MTYDSPEGAQDYAPADDPADGAAPDHAAIGAAVGPRKPRLALMGEFSAGKSSLMNLMLGHPVVPTKVTATQLPPVWIAHGEAAPWREDLSGNRHAVDPDHLEDVPLHDTAFIRLFRESEVLEVCDLIDTPGISDPNMPTEIWQRAADEADGVIWLTHATQCWRQSEAAAWDEMPEGLRASSLLLVTRFDKLLNEHDRQRVLARARRETAGLFRAVLPISLTQALAAGDDSTKWAASGGETYSDALLELIGEIEERLRTEGVLPRAQRAMPARYLAPEPEPEPEPEPGPEAETEAESNEAEADPALFADLGAGPESEPESEPEPAPEAEPQPSRPALRAVDLGEDAPASALRATPKPSSEPRPQTLRVVASTPPFAGRDDQFHFAADAPQASRPDPAAAMPRRVAPSGATPRPPRPRD